VHGHFHYPELLPDLIHRLRLNRSEVDLLLTTTSEAAANIISGILSELNFGRAKIVTVPNRGRDIGPMLTALSAELNGYDVVAHLHGKRSPHAQTGVGERWRAFLWENLVGGRHAMMDVVLAAFAANRNLGLVFPEDAHLSDWDSNRDIAEGLARRMGLPGIFPNHFDFPLGTMFWARPAALRRLFDLELGWDDYPEEPLPIDGTVLHAVERLLPFVAADAGFHYATTYVDGVTWVA
jgi:lipopolysaccharide biosynthesis protein